MLKVWVRKNLVVITIRITTHSLNLQDMNLTIICIWVYYPGHRLEMGVSFLKRTPYFLKLQDWSLTISCSLVYYPGFFRWLFNGLSGVRAERSMLHGRPEAERPPGSVGQPAGEWAASLTPLSPLYSTGPCDPVSAIIRHTCLDTDLGRCPARLMRPTLY